MVPMVPIDASDPPWVVELKNRLNELAAELDRVRAKGDGTTTRVNNGVVSALATGMPEITSAHKRHMSVVLELDTDKVAELELSEDDQWKALYHANGYERLH
ncbi:hypothetical protein PDESU_03305 [Pontiella desulfatans]|uniref:Uncharacterized protein n=1 Tax=Pontiella desulfatans TaxID=2750659 RepID=A0A6C2U5Q6_PONDE|nr:hypothetical protein [Pontiella desulfatans]VGO14736.1 hypothetical protein PDESU_03305 [Pontiella desulfatans]